jgi:uncharacterized damage-inducible protein DinB
MARVEDIRRIWHYNHVVFERFLRAIERLPSRAVTANKEIGHLSLKNTLIHILKNQEGWLHYIAQGRVKQLVALKWSYEDFPTMKSVRNHFDYVFEGTERYIHRLRDSDLARRVKAPWMPGRYTLEDAFFQVTIEQAHHLGEIIGVFWQMDRQPPDMTWIEVQRAKPARARRTRRTKR